MKMRILCLCIALFALPGVIAAYPLDAYEATGIRRLEAARLAHEGKIQSRKLPSGALLSTETLPEPDAAFTAQVVKLLGEQADRYGMAVLDLSDPAQPRYAEYRGDLQQNVGSVGKIVVALALFQALADVYPDDLVARRRILHDSVVTADAFINVDHHTVWLWNPEAQTLNRRQLQIGDRGTLWEYLDWMLSASSNAAAGMVMKHLLLLVHFGKAYPVSEAEATRFFQETPKQDLGQLLAKAMHEPVSRNGLDLAQIRQGSFFTREGKRRVPGTSSYATPRALMQFCLQMEQGKLVDVFSSREIKRLLYMTERRIRYASSPALAAAAVYFKSGSLYSCKPEVGFTCRKYHGNVKNYMNSVALVEAPATERHLMYLVTLLSNVLRKNSAVDHQTLATRMHRLIEAAHPVQDATAARGQSNHPKTQ
jgi:hypothetical protein